MVRNAHKRLGDYVMKAFSNNPRKTAKIPLRTPETRPGKDFVTKMSDLDTEPDARGREWITVF